MGFGEFFKDAWNAIDVVTILFSIITIGLWAARLVPSIGHNSHQIGLLLSHISHLIFTMVILLNFTFLVFNVGGYPTLASCEQLTSTFRLLFGHISLLAGLS